MAGNQAQAIQSIGQALLIPIAHQNSIRSESQPRTCILRTPRQDLNRICGTHHRLSNLPGATCHHHSTLPVILLDTIYLPVNFFHPSYQWTPIKSTSYLHPEANPTPSPFATYSNRILSQPLTLSRPPPHRPSASTPYLMCSLPGHSRLSPTTTRPDRKLSPAITPSHPATCHTLIS